MGDDKEIADRLVAELHRARADLESRMERHGLSPEHGWRIHEELVNTDSGTAFVLRPVHRLESTPDTLAIYIPVQGMTRGQAD